MSFPVPKVPAFARELVYSTYPLTVGQSGRTDVQSCMFLLSLLNRISPEVPVELGVSGGTSTLMMLRMLKTLATEKLYSFDISAICDHDATKNTGWLVDEHYRGSKWSLTTGVISSDIHLTLPKPADFVFIDANHSHPWPTLDLLMCIGFCKPGTWIALHDINLPKIVPQFQHWGAHYLFENWDGERLQSGRDMPYAGAVRLSANPQAHVPTLLSIIGEFPWDTIPWEGHIKRIRDRAGEFLRPYALSELDRVLALGGSQVPRADAPAGS